VRGCARYLRESLLNAIDLKLVAVRIAVGEHRGHMEPLISQSTTADSPDVAVRRIKTKASLVELEIVRGEAFNQSEICQNPCAARSRPRVLVATIAASSMAFIDSAVVNVALPTLHVSNRDHRLQKELRLQFTILTMPM
jgi:hypothetical protein